MALTSMITSTFALVAILNPFGAKNAAELIWPAEKFNVEVPGGEASLAGYTVRNPALAGLIAVIVPEKPLQKSGMPPPGSMAVNVVAVNAPSGDPRVIGVIAPARVSSMR